MRKILALIVLLFAVISGAWGAWYNFTGQLDWDLSTVRTGRTWANGQDFYDSATGGKYLFADRQSLEDTSANILTSRANGSIYSSAGQLSVPQNIQATGFNSYILNGGFELSITGVTTSDATDLAVSHDTSTPVTGSGSLTIVKDDSNQEGECVTIPVKAFDASDYDPDFGGPAILEAKFSLSNTTGFVDEDLTFVPYCETTTSNIVTANGAIAIESNQARSYKFQVPSTCLQMSAKLCVANTNTNGFTVLVDDFVIEKQDSGASGTSDVYLGELTTTGSWTTNTTYVGKYWKRGRFLVADVTLTLSGEPNAVGLDVYTPSLTIDTDYLSDTTTTAYTIKGSVSLLDAGTGNYTTSNIHYIDGTTLRLRYDNGSGFAAGITNTAPFTFVSGDKIFVHYEVPIVGWEENNKLSTPYSNRLILSTANKTGSHAGGGWEDLDNLTIIKDLTNSFTVASGNFTVPESNYYDVTIYGELAPSDSGQRSVAINYNGTRIRVASSLVSATLPVGTLVSYSFYAEKGKIIKGQYYSNAATALNYTDTYIAIKRVNNSSQRFAKEEKVIVEYTGNAGTEITADYTNIDFANKVEDSHGSWNGTTFTAKSNRRFRFNAKVLFTDSQTRTLRLYKNGAMTRTGVLVATYGPELNASLSLNIGDTVTFRCSVTAGTLLNAGFGHFLTIISED